MQDLAGLFWCSKKIHNDCGGEFNNDVMQDLHDKFGIFTSTLPGETPWSNG